MLRPDVICPFCLKSLEPYEWPGGHTMIWTHHSNEGGLWHRFHLELRKDGSGPTEWAA